MKRPEKNIEARHWLKLNYIKVYVYQPHCLFFLSRIRRIYFPGSRSNKFDLVKDFPELRSKEWKIFRIGLRQWRGETRGGEGKNNYGEMSIGRKKIAVTVYFSWSSCRWRKVGRLLIHLWLFLLKFAKKTSC